MNGSNGNERMLVHGMGWRRKGVRDLTLSNWRGKDENEEEQDRESRIQKYQPASEGTTLPTTTKSPLTHNAEFPTPPPLLLFSSSLLFTFSPLTLSLLSKNSPTSHTNNPLQPNFPPPKNLRHYHHLLLLPPPLPEIPLRRNNTKSKVSK